MKNNRYLITMTERRDGETRTIQQEAITPSREDVIKFYGLREPDIADFKIEEQ